MHLCPEVKGRITLEGKPLANQKIERSLTLEEDEYDFVYTDDDGNFSFVAKSLKSKLPGSLFYQTVIRIIIDLEYHGEIYNLWYGYQHGLKTPVEFKKHLLKLNADLTTKEKDHHLVNPNKSSEEYYIGSICRWDEQE
ncbi:DUF6795 domain-containing protein [Colwellia sp. E150_009]